VLWYACGRRGSWCGGVRASVGCCGRRAVGAAAGVVGRGGVLGAATSVVGCRGVSAAVVGVRAVRGLLWRCAGEWWVQWGACRRFVGRRGVRRPRSPRAAGRFGEPQADATARPALPGRCRPAPLWLRRAMCCRSGLRVPAGAVHGVMGAVVRLSGGGGQCGPRCAAATARPSCAANCGPPPRRVGGGRRSVVEVAVDGGGGGPERSLRGGGGGPFWRQPWPL